MRVLVTGASGLLGRYLVDRLAPGHEVFALSRRRPANEDIAWIRQDLTEPLEGLPDALDAVVHLAQSQRHRDFPDGAADIFEVNVHSTFRLLEYARHAGVDRFILASTGGLYGFAAEPLNEDAPLEPSTPYARSKLIAELLCASYGPLFHCLVLRPFFVYGETRNQMLISRLAGQIIGGQQVTVDGAPGMRINPVHGSDAASAIEAALEYDGSGTFNVAGDEIVTVTEIAERLAHALGSELKVKHSGNSPGDLIGDSTRLKGALGFSQSVALEDGLARVARAHEQGNA